MSKNNLRHRIQNNAKQVPHYGLRKLSIGVASVLLSTTLYLGIHAQAAVVQSTAVNGQPATEATTKIGKAMLPDQDTNSTASDEQKNSDPAKAVTPSTTQQTATQNFRFVDEQKEVINQDGTINADQTAISASSTGKIGTAINAPSLPVGWVSKDSQVTSGMTYVENAPTINVIIIHKTIKVDYTTPVADGAKTATGKVINGAHADDLNQSFTRQIIIENEPGKPATQTINQTATVHRDATYDDVTGEVTYGKWSTDNNGFKKYTFNRYQGDEPSSVDVPAVSVDGNIYTQPGYQYKHTFNIIYKPTEQYGKIQYIDIDNNNAQIKAVDLSGNIGDTINITYQTPAGYDLVSGQNIPATETVQGDDKGHGIPDVIIKFKHHQITVTPRQLLELNDSIMGIKNKQPGSGKPNQTITHSDLYKDLNRLIYVYDANFNLTQQDSETLKYERIATIDDVTGDVTYSDWTVAKGSPNSFKHFSVNPPAGYSYKFTSGSDADLAALTPTQKDIKNWHDQFASITYSANDQSMTIYYVDPEGNHVKGLQGSTTVNGKTGQTVYTNTVIPNGWELVKGQLPAPDMITFKGAKTPDITIKVQHRVVSVSHDHPLAYNTKTSSNQTVQGAEEDDLNKTITRTIQVNVPNSSVDIKPVTQTVTIYRDATYDDVTGEVTYGQWSTASWPIYDSFTPVAGYDKPATVKAESVTDDTKPTTVTANYSPKIWYGHYSYIDNETGKVLTTWGFSGKTGENFHVPYDDNDGSSDNILSHVPSGYQFERYINGHEQILVTTFTVNNDGFSHVPNMNEKDHSIPILLIHNQIIVNPSDLSQPGDHKDGNKNKQPGDGTPNQGITYNDLHKALTRTIIVNDPHTGAKSTTETLNYERPATIDDVTGAVTYGDWIVAKDSQPGFAEYSVPTVAGYTPKLDRGTGDELKALNPSQDQINNWQDQRIEVSYTPNVQTMTITYVDKADQPVTNGTFTVQGVTDQTVKTNAEVPAGWVLVDGQTAAPKTVTFKGSPLTDIIIKVQHGKTAINHTDPVVEGEKTPSGKPINGARQTNLNQTITRTININEPHKEPQIITQVAHLYRDATVDDVTGKVSYGDWSTDHTAWKQIDAPTVPGYQASQPEVPSIDVTDGQGDVIVNINYEPDPQTSKVINQDVDTQNKKVDTPVLSGQRAENVTITSQDPARYQINPPQIISESEQATAHENPIVTHHQERSNQTDLPQTGDHDNERGVLGLVTIGLAGMFGLAKKHRKN